MPVANTKVEMLSLSGVVFQSGAANDSLEKTLRIITTAPVTTARRGSAAPIVPPGFQVWRLLGKKSGYGLKSDCDCHLFAGTQRSAERKQVQ